jgi:very-short-patch-repair endonuclease
MARQLRGESTQGEQILWGELRGRRLDGHKFRRQHPIAGFVLDFYCAETRLAVEVDGGVHLGTQESDLERQTLIESSGIRFVRIADELVQTRLSEALDMIRSALNSSHSSPSPLDGEGARG